MGPFIPGDPSQTDTADLALMKIIIIFEQCLISTHAQFSWLYNKFHILQ